MPPATCPGIIYTIQQGNSILSVSQAFGLTTSQILAANPQISDPNRIFVGEKICIPLPNESSVPEIVSLDFFGPNGEPLSLENGAITLVPTTTIRASFSKKVAEVYFFYTPSGTETFELTQLIGVQGVDNQQTAQFQWQVSPGTLGTVFVIGCESTICSKSEEVRVYFPE